MNTHSYAHLIFNKDARNIQWKYFLLGIEVGKREGAEWVVREGVGAGGRNEPSLVCTYE
jgi:hypothetical protein